MSGLVVHHLRYSQSERIPWLCEELGVKYELKCYDRAPIFSPEEYCKLHPLCSAPVINDGPLTLAESAACVEYIAHTYGNGRLTIRPGEPGWSDYIYWFHFANGTLQPAVSRRTSQAKNPDLSNPIVKRFANKFNDILAHLDARLSSSAFLAGDSLTAADIMTVFSLTTMRCFAPFELTGYDGILAYLQRVSSRGEYRRAVEKADPQLVIGDLISAEGPPLHPALIKAAASQAPK